MTKQKKLIIDFLIILVSAYLACKALLRFDETDVGPALMYTGASIFTITLLFGFVSKQDFRLPMSRLVEKEMQAPINVKRTVLGVFAWGCFLIGGLIQLV